VRWIENRTPSTLGERMTWSALRRLAGCQGRNSQLADHGGLMGDTAKSLFSGLKAGQWAPFRFSGCPKYTNIGQTGLGRPIAIPDADFGPQSRGP